MTEFDLTREIHGAFKVTGDKGVGGGHQRATCVFLFSGLGRSEGSTHLVVVFPF